MTGEPAAPRSKSYVGSVAAVCALVSLPLVALAAVLWLKSLIENESEAEPAPVAQESTVLNSNVVPAAEREHPADESSQPQRAASEREKEAIDSAGGPGNTPAVAAASSIQPAAPPATGTPPPWQAVLSQAGEPPLYADVAFLPVEPVLAGSASDDLTQWFERVRGAGLRFGQMATRYGQSATIEGLSRLRCPWPDDGVLRLDIENCNRLKLHFFHGERGVTLVYYEELGYRWAAYATTRDPGMPTPKTWAITATDDDRCRRTELRLGGPIELRQRHGELILSRGDVVLLTAPLAGPPTDVFCEGRATIHGIALARSRDAPPAEPQRPIVADIERPAELKWSVTPSAIAQPEILGDGSLRFAGNGLSQRASCVAALPQTGIAEVILELADVSPGAGIFLGHASGRPAQVVRFVSDPRRGLLGIRLRGADDSWQADIDAPADKPAPVVQPHCWVRLLVGCGNLRWWLSADGIHWAQPEPAHDYFPAGFDSLGLELVAHCPGAQLTLKRIILRQLAGLCSLGRPDLVEQAPQLAGEKSLRAWLTAAIAQQPAEIATADWLRACSIRTLAQGTARDLSYALLEALLDDAAERQLPVQQQLAALNDAMLLALDLRDGQAMRVGLWNRYARLGLAAADAEGLPAFSSVRAAYHMAPAVTWMQLPADLDRVIRHELITHAAGQTPAAALHLIQRLRFFHQDRERPLVDWAEALARQAATGRTPSEGFNRPKETWRELLAEPLSKEAYGALTELKAAVGGEAWKDAAQLVAAPGWAAAPGIAPALHDKSLYTTVPVAIELALREFPLVAQVLREDFAALARLRVGQAIAAGDAASLQLATVQFANTPAAGEAHRWLGDRALVAGRFERAIADYERAVATAEDGSIAPRLRLAAAMLGRDAGQPATQVVQFGQVSMTAAEFESLIAELRARGPSANIFTPADPGESRVPPPSGFAAHDRSKLDGPVGDRPQEEVGRRTGQFRVPWADRQLAAVARDQTLYVSNHFQVAAYDLASGSRQWQSEAPAGTLQRAQEYGLMPMRPVVWGERIFVRLLYAARPLLVCLDRASGKIVWTAPTRERELFASDPIVVQGELVCLVISQQLDQPLQLKHCTLDPRSGEVLAQQDIVQLRGTWAARSCCEVAAVGDGLVAALGGVTVGVDGQGKIRWARTHVPVPADEDPRWLLQVYQPPLVAADRVYVAQPGVRTIDCLDAKTGRQHWSVVLPDLLAVVGLAGEVLVVHTQSDIRGLSAADGTLLWRHAAADLFTHHLVDGQHVLVASRQRAEQGAEAQIIRLTWLNASTGQTMAFASVAELADGDPRLGPLIAHAGRLFTFFGRGQFDATRDVVELAPSGQPQAADGPLSAWHALAR